MPPRRIYLDHAASTPVDPAVLRAMLPFFDRNFGNPGSLHSFGQAAQAALGSARERMAALLGADFREIIFTGSATEANNLALRGAVLGSKVKNPKVLVSAVEHESVLAAARELKNAGAEVVEIPVDREGRVDPATVRAALDRRTVLVSVMYANNELGTLQPIAEIARICYERGILFHTDAVQGVGKIPINVVADGIDLMSLSGHKIYGPKGVGALYVAPRKPPIRLNPLLQGGGHERSFRSGTLNVAGIVGFAKALELCMVELEAESQRLSDLRDFMIGRIEEKIGGATLNGPRKNRLPNNINFSFEGIRSDDLLLKMPEIAISTGSACSSGDPEPSYVIRAITTDEDRVQSAIRIGLGRWTTRHDVEKAVECLVRAISEIRPEESGSGKRKTATK